MNAIGTRVAVRTLGCKVNRVESEDVLADLLRRGASLAEESEADVVVINTCTVTSEADAKARKAVRHALRQPRRPIVVVTGCLAALDAPGLRALGERVVVEADKAAVVAKILERVPSAPSIPGEQAECGADGRAVADQSRAGQVLTRDGEGFRTRAMLKVEDGCDSFCSYCIVPYARGVPRAVPLEELAESAQSLVAGGVREIVLTGINIGRYADRDADLAEVVRRVAASGVDRIRVSSIEPLDLDERLLDVLADTPALCRHLHVPLQSGSDRVLAEMNRGYTVEQFCERIEAARQALPGLVVTTDLLAGFPGETEAEADQTYQACASVGFGRLHVFRYSERAGTPAAVMDCQVPAAERAQRAARLRELDERLRARHLTAASGQIAEVLVERVDVEHGERVARGTSRTYLSVRFASETVEVGDLVSVTLTGANGAIARGGTTAPGPGFPEAAW